MSNNQTTQIFNHAQTWSQRVLNADEIYAQIEDALQTAGKSLPQTPRRPDIRLILDNDTGQELNFLNPGDHSKQQPEIIPATGNEKSVMVMLKGNTLAEQNANAETLVKRFNLLEKGLTKDFIQALGTESTNDLVDEAYGPAPFSDQADKLVPLDWENQDGSTTVISATKDKLCAYGARAATPENVFRSEIALFIKGTGTTAECVESTAMCIAVSTDWKSGKQTTRPIVPSIAREFYGAHYDTMPCIAMTPTGEVQSIDLKNGEIIYLAPKSIEGLNATTSSPHPPILPRQ
tara:strand:- start:180886 stop:181758 length:873 start_codon:yes stop_codon:yes gene_type:complete